MPRIALALLVLISLGCSVGRVPITVQKGDANAFAEPRRFCIYASDSNSNQDVEAVLARELAKVMPGIDTRRPCGGDELHVAIQYSSGLSSCTHCPPPYTGPRFAFAFLQVRTGCDIHADAEWTSFAGGSVERLARSFAMSFARLVEDRARAKRGGV